MADRRGGLDGPAGEDVKYLCRRAAGLFVYAVAIARFLDHKNNDPRRQLDFLLQSPERSELGGGTKLKANTTLDSLYTSNLKPAPSLLPWSSLRISFPHPPSLDQRTSASQVYPSDYHRFTRSFPSRTSIAPCNPSMHPLLTSSPTQPDAPMRGSTSLPPVITWSF